MTGESKDSNLGISIVTEIQSPIVVLVADNQYMF